MERKIEEENDAVLYNDLKNTIDTLGARAAIEGVRPDAVAPERTAFSDSLVLSVPRGRENEFGLVLNLAWLAQELLGLGFFCRGGVSVGRLHHSGGTVFGQGVIDAYELESRIASHPRIVLAPRLTARLQKHIETTERIWRRLILSDDDGMTYVNPLAIHEIGFYGTGVRKRALREVRKLVTAQIKLSRPSGTSPQQDADLALWTKMQWFARYFNALLEHVGTSGVRPIAV